MTEIPHASGLNDEAESEDSLGILFPRQAETFGSVDVIPGTEHQHPGFCVRKFELRTRRYGRRMGGSGTGGARPRVVFLVSLSGGEHQREHHPRFDIDLLRFVRVATNLRKSTAFKTLVLPG
jgi:hypothetical protein